MADGFTATLDASAVLDALKRFPDVCLKYTKPASKISADNIQSEARRRVRRMTGQTAEGIQVLESYDKTGYVVLTSDARVDAGQLVTTSRYGSPQKGRIAPAHKQEKHVGLWLEGGTKHMAPKPFFYNSARLEVAAHARRIDEAVGRAIAESGLGA